MLDLYGLFGGPIWDVRALIKIFEPDGTQLFWVSFMDRQVLVLRHVLNREVLSIYIRSGELWLTMQYTDIPIIS